MLRRLAVMLMLMPPGACTLGGSPPAPPAPPQTTQALIEACDARDRAACVEVAERLQREGRTPEALRPLAIACQKISAACHTYGLILLRGEGGVPVDKAKGMEAMGLGCTVRPYHADACGWNALAPLRDPVSEGSSPTVLANRADVAGLWLDGGCRRGKSDFACTNYGIALSCGLLGPPDVPFARHVLDRGCDLGDTRACALDIQLRDDPSNLPPCDGIGGDPEHPVDLELHLVPPPPGATLPPDVEPFQRRPMPPPDRR